MRSIQNTARGRFFRNSNSNTAEGAFGRAKRGEKRAKQSWFINFCQQKTCAPIRIFCIHSNITYGGGQQQKICTTFFSSSVSVFWYNRADQSYEWQILYRVYLLLSKVHFTDLLKDSNTSQWFRLPNDIGHFESLWLKENADS